MVNNKTDQNLSKSTKNLNQFNYFDPILQKVEQDFIDRSSSCLFEH